MRVMQNSSLLTNVSLLGKSELVTPTLLIWSSQADKHSSFLVPTYKNKRKLMGNQIWLCDICIVSFQFQLKINLLLIHTSLGIC